MSEPSWQRWLARTLRSRRRPDGPVRVAVVGIGHELRGDDAAGVAVVRVLKTRLRDQRTRSGRPASRAPQPIVLVIDGGPAPENHTATLRRFAPDVILFVDSAEMGVRPGSVRRLRQEAVSGVTASTHTLPVSVLAEYLERETNCVLTLVGIQPARNGLGDPLSPLVAAAVERVARSLDRTLTRVGRAADRFRGGRPALRSLPATIPERGAPSGRPG